MTCLSEDAVLAFVRGTLPVAARAAAEAHIDGCEECRLTVGAVATMVTMLSGSPPDTGINSWILARTGQTR